MFLIALLVLGIPNEAGGQAPDGRFAQVGLAGVPGLGLQAGLVSARTMLTRELNLVADFKPAGSRGTISLSAALGGSVRLLGIERTIFGVPYRGYDLDVGMRVGPGLVFRIDETRASKNKRFDLFLEPFARFTVRRRSFTWYFEAGTHRPSIRAGFWLPLR